MSDTSKLDAQLDEILTALEPQHKTMNKRRAKQALLALIAQREQAAELRGQMSLIEKTEKVDDDKLRAYLRDKEYDLNQQLQATKPEKETT